MAGGREERGLYQESGCFFGGRRDRGLYGGRNV